MNCINIQNLSCYSNENIILDNITINIKIKKGKGLSIMGDSGSGKSTFVNALLSLNTEMEQSGKILINNEPIKKGDIIIGTQEFLLFHHLTVRENIEIASKNKEFQDEIIDIFKMSHLLEKYPQELSGGEQQRVSLLRAICCLPRILILDEPFSNIDDNIKYSILDFLKKSLAKFNVFTILVTHNVKEVYALTDDILVMSKGKILYCGDIQDCYHTHNPEIAKILGEYNEINLNAKTLIIRPEEFIVHSNIEDVSVENIMFLGVIMESKFHGMYYRNIVRLYNEQLIVVYTQQPLIVENKYKLTIHRSFKGA